jgi:hypothetical protein
MKWNQGVAFAHGERLSGAGVFVIRNPAGDEATYALGVDAVALVGSYLAAGHVFGPSRPALAAEA